ncbi:MAG: hypothetical protein NZM40_06650 [Sphingomonadaceae bacterium]|uniref:hypothetical protein n=1 Tax=Thermaurantiacus sp. TaxID=2820283 RepID=UPI00298EF5EA|nr:hypothetical protein [Thermaurantiacus sp.]MCS6987096.1 hypothetical protein [Sphingomonadaceae bacterium]MDW8415566.1 hypothetical protein [Thermaurantiacus sp.]
MNELPSWPEPVKDLDTRPPASGQSTATPQAAGAAREGPSRVAQGVEELIGELRERGVAEGRRAAARIVAEARTEADRIVSAARAEADRILAEARAAAEAERAGLHEALKTAARDAMQALRAELFERFRTSFRRQVAEALDRPRLVEAVILALVDRATVAAGVRPGARLEVTLPDRPPSLERLRADPEAARQDPLTRFVSTTLAELAAQGLVVFAGPHDRPGLHVRLVEEGVEIDLSDEAVAAALLAHLAPRFHAWFEGIAT